MPATDLIGIKVRITINAKNGLRRVVFGLEKKTEGDEVDWTINFQLFERESKNVPFGDALVDVFVEVDKKLHTQADAVAKKRALSSGQAAHAIGPAADDAKAAEAGEISREEADESIESTLAKK